ncbi:MAG: pyridoxamine 5'-phosphate oxidase family protein [Terriglobales bacterium]
MGILTEDIKRLVSEQRLGFVAIVCPDGTPNLSPKGTTAVLKTTITSSLLISDPPGRSQISDVLGG